MKNLSKVLRHKHLNIYCYLSALGVFASLVLQMVLPTEMQYVALQEVVRSDFQFLETVSFWLFLLAGCLLLLLLGYRRGYHHGLGLAQEKKAES